MRANFKIKRTTLTFFGQNLLKNEFCGQSFKNLSLDLESAPPRYHMHQFLVKMDSFEFFLLNLGKFPITCNILVRIKLRVLQRAEWRLKWAGWSWVEVGAGFSNTHIITKFGRVNKVDYRGKTRYFINAFVCKSKIMLPA